MPLPKIKQPLFELTIPSTNKKVKYRPFTVKEEKILLIAQESKDIDQIVTAIKQIVTNCIQGDIDADQLAMFDLEYILIQIRSNSVDSSFRFSITDPDTEEEVEIELDVKDIQIHRDEKHKKIIEIADGVSIVMTYPRLEQMKMFMEAQQDGSTEKMFNVMMGCIDSVVDGEEVYKLKDFSQEEVDEFLSGLTAKNVNHIRDFFSTMPKIRFETKYTNKDGKERTFVAQGTETFFL